jgi:tripartite-type tricarboxylate transporter receptor subunit TctC
MNRWKSVALVAAGLLAVGTVHAQGYPAKPIRWIVPYTPGGLTDNVTRLVTQKIQESVGQPVVVRTAPARTDHRRDHLARDADGYTP